MTYNKIMDDTSLAPSPDPQSHGHRGVGAAIEAIFFSSQTALMDMAIIYEG